MKIIGLGIGRKRGKVVIVEIVIIWWERLIVAVLKYIWVWDWDWWEKIKYYIYYFYGEGNIKY